MEFNDQQKRYIEKISKDLIGDVKNYINSIPDFEKYPNEYNIFISPDPSPELFWGERYRIGVHLRFIHSQLKYVYMDIVVILCDKILQITVGIAKGAISDFKQILNEENTGKKLEEKIFELIEKAESI